MGKILNRVNTELKTLCGCFSVAMQQARQSEIDVLSRRSFRHRNGLGDSPPAHLRDTGLAMNELMTRLGIGLRTFQSCCSEAQRRAEQGEIDTTARRFYQEMQRAARKGEEGTDPIPGKEIAGVDGPGEMHADWRDRLLEKAG